MDYADGVRWHMLKLYIGSWRRHGDLNAVAEKTKETPWCGQQKQKIYGYLKGSDSDKSELTVVLAIRSGYQDRVLSEISRLSDRYSLSWRLRIFPVCPVWMGGIECSFAYQSIRKVFGCQVISFGRKRGIKNTALPYLTDAVETGVVEAAGFEPASRSPLQTVLHI